MGVSLAASSTHSQYAMSSVLDPPGTVGLKLVAWVVHCGRVLVRAAACCVCVRQRASLIRQIPTTVGFEFLPVVRDVETWAAEQHTHSPKPQVNYNSVCPSVCPSVSIRSNRLNQVMK